MKAFKLFFVLTFAFASSTLFSQSEQVLESKNSKEAYTYGLQMMNIHKYEKAVEYFTEAIELKSDLAAAYYFRAYCYCELDQKAKACEDLHKASSLGHYVEKVAVPCGCDAKDPQ